MSARKRTQSASFRNTTCAWFTRRSCIVHLTSKKSSKMVLDTLTRLTLIVGFVCAAPANEAAQDTAAAAKELVQDSDDLQVDASNSYGRRFSDWRGYSGAGNYNNYVTGYGVLDERYSPYNNGGYDIGYKGYDRGYAGYGGYPSNTGYGGYPGNSGYGGYNGYSGYDGNSGTYGVNSVSGNGGYGGFGGNGGLNSYYGYNNPYYQGANHLGHGYYKKSGYGNIYSGITPSLVTGYRGYSRR
ncbi:hypothetical protein ACJJTC_015725 [Scirpophaga incertulas]